MTNLHPFDRAVLNSQLAQRGFAPVPGPTDWWPYPTTPAPEQENQDEHPHP